MPNTVFNGMTNVQLWNMVRKADSNFENHTSKATEELFTERGWKGLQSRPDTVNDFLKTLVMIGVQRIRSAKAKNIFADKGVVEVFENEYGGIVQRMVIENVKPISPKYLNLENGKSVDQQVVRKANVKEQFHMANFDYQSLITMPSDEIIKNAFIRQYGIAAIANGMLEALANGYTTQECVNTYEMINAALNDPDLKDSQVISVTMSDPAQATSDELASFILTLNDLASAMKVSSQTSAYNSYDFKTALDPTDHVLLIKPALLNRIKVNTLTGAFNPEYLNLPFEIVEVENFGGLTAYMDDNYSTVAYPVHDELGTVIGFSNTEGATTPTKTETEVFYKDPNANVLAVVMQRGFLFEESQNPYSVRPAPYNAAGLYQDLWASRPGTILGYDISRSLVKVVAE